MVKRDYDFYGRPLKGIFNNRYLNTTSVLGFREVVLVQLSSRIA